MVHDYSRGGGEIEGRFGTLKCFSKIIRAPRSGARLFAKCYNFSIFLK